MQAYFDNSATTKPCEEAVEAMMNALTQCWGNPSSLHAKGMQADEILTSARKAVAARVGCTPDEIYFTSGGTESNNTALFGAAKQMKRNGKKIVSTTVEHPSVYEALTRLENEGFEVVRLPVDSTGKISEEALFEAIDSETILVSIMAVNNEVGSIQPVAAARRAILMSHSPALLHCDAVQIFGKMPFKPSSMGIDLMSISSHKIHGPKGVGALYIRKGVKIAQHAFGGEQEKHFRPGTQAMPAIAGFGAAAKALPDLNAQLEETAALRDYMVSRLNELGGVVINSPADALPYITNISIPGKRSEPMLSFLSEKGVYVSSGSACSRGKKSRVLVEMGLDNARLESPVRISFSHSTTKEEIDYLIDCIAEGQRVIRGTI